jgi:hypothetical protein
MSAPGLKITNFHYSNMTMPRFEITEYPKWIHMSGYPDILAQDAAEEAALLARSPKSGDVAVQLVGAQAEASAAPMGDPPPHILTGTNDEREILIRIAKEKDIKIDARWKTDRIRATIERETKEL